MREIDQIWLTMEAYSIVGAGTAVAAIALWVLCVRRHSLFPPQRHRFVSWTGVEILLVLFLVLLFWPSLAGDALSHLGFFKKLYGPSFGTEAVNAFQSQLDVERRRLWTGVLVWPFQIASIVLIPRLLSRTKLYQLGLSLKDLGKNIFSGWLSWVVLAPLVLGCHFLTEWATRAVGQAPEEHALLRLFENRTLPVEGPLVLLSAALLAPVVEELLFRGVLQPWFAEREWGGNLAMLAALVVTILLCWSRTHDPVHPLRATDPEILGAVLFAMAMIPGAYVLERVIQGRLAPPSALRAIYGTSLLFAMFHTTIWPTPIPLFFLALGLGYLRYRTQSVVGPMVLHSLFNMIACLALFLS